MLSALPQGCPAGIPANPDISGIGIRASIYAQNLIGVFLAAYYLIDSKITPEEAEYIETTSVAILMTGCAILISAFIQAKTNGLSAYHAMIVLNLIFSTALSRREIKKKKFPLPRLLGVAHLSLMGGFGIWLWKDIDTFGNSTACKPYLFTVIFGHKFFAMNKLLREWSLIAYGVAVIPFVNTFTTGLITAIVSGIVGILFILIAYGRFYLFDHLIHRYLNRRHYTNLNNNKDAAAIKRREFVALSVSYVGSVLFLDILFTVDTELMIHRSRSFVQSGESKWTFGQTLAVIVTIIPVLEARKCIEWWWTSRIPSHSQSQIKSVSLDYQGNAPLTVKPSIDGLRTITKGSPPTAIIPNIEEYKFSVKDSIVATIRNHDDDNTVEIEGGTSVEGTEPFTVAVHLKRAAPR